MLDLEPVNVPSQQASPLSLMLNELMMNAMKHAFPPGRAGQLTIKVEDTGHHLQVVIADNGVGMPDATARGGFGSRLIRTLARQLQAEVLWSPACPGTIVTMRLPIRPVDAKASR